MATLKLFGNLRKQINGTHLQISGAHVGAIIEQLCTRYPTLQDDLLEAGQLRPYYRIMLNGHDISLAAGLDTPVGENDQIAIFPPLAGG